MEVPAIPEDGINEIVIQQINDYISLLIQHSIKYGNSILMSTRDEYFKQITKDFQEWYKKYPEVQSIKCVKEALIFCKTVEEEEYLPMKRTKYCTTLDEESG
jgi:hypothetical protein